MGVTVREKVKGSGAWWVFVNHDGKRKSKLVGDKKAAKEAARKIEAALASGKFIVEDEAMPTFGELAKEWIALTVPATCKASTLKDYQRLLANHILRRFGSKPVDQITRLMIKDFLLQKGKSGLAGSTVRHMLNVISGVMTRAVEAGYIAHNPGQRMGRGVIRIKDRKADIEPLTTQELDHLLEVVRDRFPNAFPMILTLARTGMRLGEARGLEWGDIDFRGGFIMIRRGVSRERMETPKSGKGRRVDMSRQLAAVLLDLRARRKREALAKGWGKVPDRVFLSAEGKPVHDYHFRNRIWYKALEYAGLRRVRIHDLRHTFASLLIQNGESLAYVRDQLGHCSISLTVDTYGHLAPDGNRNAVDKLDNHSLTPSLFTHPAAPYTHPDPMQKGPAEANPL